MRLGRLIQPDERLTFVTKEHIALGCKVRVICRDRTVTADLNRPAQRPFVALLFVNLINSGCFFWPIFQSDVLFQFINCLATHRLCGINIKQIVVYRCCIRTDLKSLPTLCQRFIVVTLKIVQRIQSRVY